MRRDHWDGLSIHDGPQTSPGFQLWSGFMGWQRGVNGVLKPLGITQPQFGMLAVLGWMTRTSQEITQQDLVDFLGFDRMHVSQLATRLEADGLITRTRSTGDKRAKVIALSPKGQALLTRALPLVEAFDQAFFAAGPNPPSAPPAGSAVR